MFETQRMSQNYILLDFLADDDLYNYGQPLDLERVMTEENLIAGQTFVDKMLEPLTCEYGPASIAAGFLPEAVRRGHYDGSPHRWDYKRGAAVDAAFHRHVNNDESPIKLLYMIDRMDDMVFHRLISYCGSEFVCLCYREVDNLGTIIENERVPGKKGLRKVGHSKRKKGHGKGEREMRRHMPPPDPPDWRREEGEGVRTSKNLLAQHVRVGRYFVLLDFCRSVAGLRKGIRTVPPVSLSKWDFPEVTVARMFAEILDPMQEHYPRLSVIRGMEPRGMSDDENAGKHRWIAGGGGRHRLEFLMTLEEEWSDVRKMLGDTEHVVSVEAERWGDGKSIHFAMEIEEFEPAVIWSSAARPGGGM